MQSGYHSSDKGQLPSPLHMHFKIFRVDFHFYHGLLTQKYVRSWENLLGTSEDSWAMNDPNRNFLTPVYSLLKEIYQVRQTLQQSPILQSSLLFFRRSSHVWQKHVLLEADGWPQYPVRGSVVYKLEFQIVLLKMVLVTSPTFPQRSFPC